MTIRSAIAFCALVLMCGVCAGCANHVPTQQGAATTTAAAPKNVILVIADGMGPQQVGLLEDYANRAPNSVYQGRKTVLSQFAAEGVMGMSRHGPYDGLVVDSACSATQLATGVPARSEMIGLDADGNSVQTVLERAKELGKSTGLVSDTRITHATPAAFAAHQPHRRMENEIAVDLLAEGDVDVMLSGGRRHFIPSGNDSKRKDNRDLRAEAQKMGYQLASNRSELNTIQQGRILGLFASSAMMDGIAYKLKKSDPTEEEPSLPEMTRKALEILSQDDDGFFLMVEAGQIDWAAHANDAGTLLHELLKLDDTLQTVYDWVKDRQDTLVVITADHETGGFGFSYSRKGLPPPTKLPGIAFRNQPYKPDYNFGPLTNLDQLYMQKMSLFGLWFESKGGGSLPTPESLRDAVNRHSEYKITLVDAKQILQREKNEYFVAGHKYLGSATFPKVQDFKEFYVYGDDVHVALIGRALAKQQNVVWSTGTHTHTPVPVIAWGPKVATEQFSAFLHHTQIGQLLRKAVESSHR